MKEIVGYGSTSRIEWFFITDSATGSGKTGLTNASSGLRIDVGRPGDAAATSYTVAAGNVETITTIGTYQAPTTGKVRFKERNAAALPGFYEVHFADALYNNTGSRKSLCGIVHGASGMLPTPFQIQLDLTNTNVALSSSERNAIAAALLDLADGVETGLTPRGAARLALAALAGKLSGAATTTVVIRNAVQDSKNRITATVDGNGNRTAVATDVT